MTKVDKLIARLDIILTYSRQMKAKGDNPQDILTLVEGDLVTLLNDIAYVTEDGESAE